MHMITAKFYNRLSVEVCVNKDSDNLLKELHNYSRKNMYQGCFQSGEDGEMDMQSSSTIEQQRNSEDEEDEGTHELFMMENKL